MKLSKEVGFHPFLSEFIKSEDPNTVNFIRKLEYFKDTK
jgi:hypothetical protein